jgi:E3 ubiquitin-protein ligase HUWE1
MEDSQISVLPPDLAQEAQNLRREWEARNRQLMQERLFGHVSQSSSALSSILRSSGTGKLLHKYEYSRSVQQLRLFIMFFMANLRFQVLMAENINIMLFWVS